MRELLPSLCQAQQGPGWAWAVPLGTVPFGNSKGLTVGSSRAGSSFGAGCGDRPGREWGGSWPPQSTPTSPPPSLSHWRVWAQTREQLSLPSPQPNSQRSLSASQRQEWVSPRHLQDDPQWCRGGHEDDRKMLQGLEHLCQRKRMQELGLCSLEKVPG